MALTVRRRGDIWHARGTVRVGREIIRVAEFSTGCRAQSDALTVAADEEARLRADRLDGAAGRAKRLTIADCLLAYIQRSKGVRARDEQPIAAMNDALGHRPIAEAADAWRDWVRTHRNHAPGTLAKYRSILAAALRFGAVAHQVPAPTLPGVHVPQREPAPPLPDDVRERLLAAYSPHAACPVLLLAELGARTGEVLRLDWRDCQPAAGVIHFRASETKSGKARRVPMTPRVALLLWGMWEAAGRPRDGTVFLSARGVAYADQRKHGGGSPLEKAHATACRRAGVTDFRLHDWRHDFTGRKVADGVDLLTLARLLGWKNTRMLEEVYGGASPDHLRRAMKVA
jgi:integrase